MPSDRAVEATPSPLERMLRGIPSPKVYVYPEPTLQRFLAGSSARTLSEWAFGRRLNADFFATDTWSAAAILLHRLHTQPSLITNESSRADLFVIPLLPALPEYDEYRRPRQPRRQADEVALPEAIAPVCDALWSRPLRYAHLTTETASQHLVVVPGFTPIYKFCMVRYAILGQPMPTSVNLHLLERFHSMYAAHVHFQVENALPSPPPPSPSLPFHTTRLIGCTPSFTSADSTACTKTLMYRQLRAEGRTPSCRYCLRESAHPSSMCRIPRPCIRPRPCAGCSRAGGSTSPRLSVHSTAKRRVVQYARDSCVYARVGAAPSVSFTRWERGWTSHRRGPPPHST